MLVCSSPSSSKNATFSFSVFWTVTAKVKLLFALLLHFSLGEDSTSNYGMSPSFLIYCGQVKDVTLMVTCIFDLLACVGVDLSSCNDFVVCGVDLG